MINVNYHNNIRNYVFKNGEKESFPYFTIGKHSYINDMKIHCSPGSEIINIHIGNYCSIAYNVFLLINRNHDYKSISSSPLLEQNRKLAQKGQVIIGHDVWIGNDVTILSGVTIGNGAVIGAGAVVTKDVAPYAVVVGNPMQTVKFRFTDEQIAKLLKIKWWNWDDATIEINKRWFGEGIDDFIKNFEVGVKNIDKEGIRMERKSMSALLIPDFDDPYPVWINVINQYLQHFSSSHDISLLIRVEQNNSFENNIKKIQQLLLQKDLPDILIINDPVEEEKDLFIGIDYFITTRSVRTLEYMDYAAEYGVKILSGVDVPIFDSVKVERK